MGADDTTQTTQPRRREDLERWVMQLLFSGKPCDDAPPVWLAGRKTTVGRSHSCTVVLEDDPRASRVHATLEVGTGAAATCTIVDSSANGTFVNGRRVSQATLRDGDVIRVGDSFLLCRRRQPDADDEALVEELLGSSPAMADLRRVIDMVGPTRAFVLIQGETGTGKELVARAIHRRYRPEGPFVPVNCSAIPDTLAESALFGHLRGAFSGAEQAQPGYFRDADGGVLFLDEVGELPLTVQPKLLRTLEDGTVTPVGATRPVACDVRVLAATNRNLPDAIRVGDFRADLYARLAEITVTTPPLRERREDLLPILQQALGADSPPLEPDLIDALLQYQWPFNVRELIKLASELRIRGAGAPALQLALIQHRLEAIQPVTHARAAPATREAETARGVPARGELEALLRTHRGRIADVARATGRSRKQVYRWIERYGLDLESFRSLG